MSAATGHNDRNKNEGNSTAGKEMVHFGQTLGSWQKPESNEIHFIAVLSNAATKKTGECELVYCNEGERGWLKLPPLLNGPQYVGVHRSRIVAITYSSRQRSIIALDEDIVSRCVCLLKIDPRRGTIHTTAALVSKGQSIRDVKSLCYGPKSFGKMAAKLRRDSVLLLHGNESYSPPGSKFGVSTHTQLYCVVQHNPGLRLRSDAICRVEEATGLVSPVILTGRDDVVALAATPGHVGPWGDAVLYFWSISSGLYVVHWGRDGGEIKNVRDQWMAEHRTNRAVKTSGIYLQYSVCSLMFSNAGKLYASASNAILEVNIHDGSCTEVPSIPRCMEGSVDRCCWVPHIISESKPQSSKFGAPRHLSVAEDYGGKHATRHNRLDSTDNNFLEGMRAKNGSSKHTQLEFKRTSIPLVLATPNSQAPSLKHVLEVPITAAAATRTLSPPSPPPSPPSPHSPLSPSMTSGLSNTPSSAHWISIMGTAPVTSNPEEFGARSQIKRKAEALHRERLALQRERKILETLRQQRLSKEKQLDSKRDHNRGLNDTFKLQASVKPNVDSANAKSPSPLSSVELRDILLEHSTEDKQTASFSHGKGSEALTFKTSSLQPSPVRYKETSAVTNSEIASVDDMPVESRQINKTTKSSTRTSTTNKHTYNTTVYINTSDVNEEAHSQKAEATPADFNGKNAEELQLQIESERDKINVMHAAASAALRESVQALKNDSRIRHAENNYMQKQMQSMLQNTMGAMVELMRRLQTQQSQQHYEQMTSQQNAQNAASMRQMQMLQDEFEKTREIQLKLEKQMAQQQLLEEEARLSRRRQSMHQRNERRRRDQDLLDMQRKELKEEQRAAQLILDEAHVAMRAAKAMDKEQLIDDAKAHDDQNEDARKASRIPLPAPRSQSPDLSRGQIDIFRSQDTEHTQDQAPIHVLVTRSPDDIRIGRKERKRAEHEALLREAAKRRREELDAGMLKAMHSMNLRGQAVAGLLVAEDEVERVLAEQARQSTTHTAAFHGSSSRSGNSDNSNGNIPEHILGCGSDMRGSMSGFGMGERGQLYLSMPNNFDNWKRIGRPRQRLTALARNTLGIVFAVAGGMLWKVNIHDTAGRVWTPVVQLQHEGSSVNLRGLCFSNWLERSESLYGLLSNDENTSSSICTVDVATGAVQVLCPLNKGIIDAIVSPPLTGGPWHRLVFMFWARGQGLFGVSWANEHFSVRPLIVGQGAENAGIRGLGFDATDTLYGVGSSLWQLNPFKHNLTRIGTLNNSLMSFCFLRAEDGSQIDGQSLENDINQDYNNRHLERGIVLSG